MAKKDFRNRFPRNTDKRTTVMEMANEYLACQEDRSDSTDASTSLTIRVSHPPSDEIMLKVLRRSNDDLAVLPKPSRDGLKIDPTWRNRDTDYAKSIPVGVRVRDLNCASHTMIQLARVLNLHQTVVDQVPLAARRRLTTVAQMMYSFVQDSGCPYPCSR